MPLTEREQLAMSVFAGDANIRLTARNIANAAGLELPSFRAQRLIRGLVTKGAIVEAGSLLKKHGYFVKTYSLGREVPCREPLRQNRTMQTEVKNYLNGRQCTTSEIATELKRDKVQIKNVMTVLLKRGEVVVAGRSSGNRVGRSAYIYMLAGESSE